MRLLRIYIQKLIKTASRELNVMQKKLLNDILWLVSVAVVYDHLILTVQIMKMSYRLGSWQIL